LPLLNDAAEVPVFVVTETTTPAPRLDRLSWKRHNGLPVPVMLLDTLVTVPPNADAIAAGVTSAHLAAPGTVPPSWPGTWVEALEPAAGLVGLVGLTGLVEVAPDLVAPALLEPGDFVEVEAVVDPLDADAVPVALLPAAVPADMEEETWSDDRFEELFEVHDASTRDAAVPMINTQAARRRLK
jgi:hypothetical protein